MAYATKTLVSVDRSQAEIRKILAKYGASGFAYAESGPLVYVLFEMQKRRIKFVVPLPKSQETKNKKHFDQLCRSRWRALVLAIKAKLECVDSGITTLEQEFLAHILLPNGKTVGNVMLPQIENSYRDGKMPPLLGFN